MVEFKEIFNTFNRNRKEHLSKSFYGFLFDLKKENHKLKMNIDTKCLVLSQYPGAETKALGGLIAQYPKNFEVLCLTNGSEGISGVDTVDSIVIMKQRFNEVMKNSRVKGYKIFDIENKSLAANYKIFRKIDISEVDYIFVPNIYDTNPDTLALLRHFKELLKEKEHKANLIIFMFESDSSLAVSNYYVNIDSIIETKKKMIETIYPKDKNPDVASKILGLNAFRSQDKGGNFAEAFLSLTVEEFCAIPIL